jgi:ribonuclease VapC
MVLDTSALVAILRGEPERRRFLEAIDAADACHLSAATLVETSIVLEARFGADGVQALDRLIQRAGIEVVPVDAEQAREARRGFSRFGKGRDVAGLNYGDCFAYALASVLGEPLLFKGDDFSRTDIAIAVLGPGQE